MDRWEVEILRRGLRIRSLPSRAPLRYNFVVHHQDGLRGCGDVCGAPQYSALWLQKGKELTVQDCLIGKRLSGSADRHMASPVYVCAHGASNVLSA